MLCVLFVHHHEEEQRHSLTRKSLIIIVKKHKTEHTIFPTFFFPLMTRNYFLSVSSFGNFLSARLSSRSQFVVYFFFALMIINFKCCSERFHVSSEIIYHFFPRFHIPLPLRQIYRRKKKREGIQHSQKSRKIRKKM